MKTQNPKTPKKEVKKAVKKALEKSLTDKFLEVVKQLGHDAEKIGKDIEIAGKFVAKKLSKRLKDLKEATDNKLEAVKEATEPAAKVKEIKKSTVKGAKTAKKIVKKAASKAKPVVQSVKVAAIATEEKAAEAIAKPLKKVVEKNTPAKAVGTVSKTPARKPAAPKKD